MSSLTLVRRWVMIFILYDEKNDDPQEGDRRVLSSGCNKEIGIRNEQRRISHKLLYSIRVLYS